MSLPPIPGLGWTTPSNSKVELHAETFKVVPGDEFPGVAPTRLLNLIDHNVPDFNSLCMDALRQYTVQKPNFTEELEEFLTTGMSNEREMKWHLMKIAPNTSFRLHAHQNIELIYVIRGSMNEIRMCSPPPKRIFDVDEKEGPKLSGEDLLLNFEHRQTSSRSLPSSRFLVNEKGSIHLSYTVDDGAELLVLWSGSHGNIPADHYPRNASEVLKLPATVQPYVP